MSRSGPSLNYVELPAAALQDMKAFYTAVFGWTWIDYGPTYAASHAGEIEIGLNAEARPAPVGEPGAENAIGPLLLFSTDHLDAFEITVREAGGAIVSGPYSYPGGRRFHFRDPGGNVLGVYESDPAA